MNPIEVARFTSHYAGVIVASFLYPVFMAAADAIFDRHPEDYELKTVE